MLIFLTGFLAFISGVFLGILMWRMEVTDADGLPIFMGVILFVGSIYLGGMAINNPSVTKLTIDNQVVYKVGENYWLPVTVTTTQKVIK